MGVRKISKYQVMLYMKKGYVVRDIALEIGVTPQYLYKFVRENNLKEKAESFTEDQLEVLFKKEYLNNTYGVGNWKILSKKEAKAHIMQYRLEQDAKEGV